MRIDILTIFPEFFDVLDVSLLGKARDDGTLNIRVHALRAWTTDRHQTVDDTPFGGGAGMVMKPDVWGAALDDVLGAVEDKPILIVPTPSGEVFTQEKAVQLAVVPRLVFACGRYEGIDARVVAHYRSQGVEVQELSLGDYVVNGGEVAAMAMIEAIARLVPGVIGNADSLCEESHSDGLLEYPAYTRPATWRDLTVPPVLLSGDHARIHRWHRDQALARTASVRPDLIAALDVAKLDVADRELLAAHGYVWAEGTLQPVVIRSARADDAAALADLAARTFPRACPPGLPVADQKEFIATQLTTKLFQQRIANPANNLVDVAEVAGNLVGYTWVKFPQGQEPPPAADVAAVVTARPQAELSKIYVDVEYAGTGVAGVLIDRAITAAADRGIAVLWLGTNDGNRRAQRFYRRHGLRKVGTRSFLVGDYQNLDAIMAIEFD